MKVMIAILDTANTSLEPTESDPTMPAVRDALQGYDMVEGWQRIQVADNRELWVHPAETRPTQQEWNHFAAALGKPDEIYIIMHATGMARHEAAIEAEAARRFPNARITTRLFTRQDTDPVFVAFCGLVRRVSHGR
jgi:hypothetical protein